MTATRNDVELERDHYWWLHPAIRGRQAMGGDAGQLPSRWITRDEAQSATVDAVEPVGPYGDFAKLLYKLNGYKPGPVTGWYVVVASAPDQYAVGQLWVDPDTPVVLFSDLVFDDEATARDAAARLRAENPGLLHR